MEILATTEMIGKIVAFIGERFSKGKSINAFILDFSDATMNWIKPLFLKDDGSEKEIIENLKEKPESKARQKAVESIMEIELEDNPKAEKYIKEIFEKVSETEKEATIIKNSRNVLNGNVNTNGGDFHLGDDARRANNSSNLSEIIGNNNIIIQDIKDASISIVKDKIMK